MEAKDQLRLEANVVVGQAVLRDRLKTPCKQAQKHHVIRFLAPETEVRKGHAEVFQHAVTFLIQLFWFFGFREDPFSAAR